MGKASRRKREAGPQDSTPPPAPFTSEIDDEPRWITRPLLFILAAGALFRILYYFQYRSGSVFFGAPFLDAGIYDGWARRIASGEWSSPEPFYFAPGYPYALAALYRFVSTSLS